MRKERKLLKALAAALITAMAFQSAALAAPMDELNDILEKQQEIESDLDVALEEQLGLTELGEAVEENGVRFVIDLEPGDKALTDPSLLDVLPEESYYHGNLQVDKNLKKWLLESGVGTAENALLDVSLYGDEQKLAISIPQFFEGAISIEAGSFLDQYNSSVLKELIESLNLLEPLGEGNRMPIFAFRNLRIDSIRALTDGKHLKLKTSMKKAI